MAREMVVKNVADLGSLKVGYGDHVQTQGYYAAGDGGGNLYRFQSSVVTPDGGFNIGPPTGVTGSYAALDQSIANVKQFGAKGDAVTNDTTRIQAAINAVKPANIFTGSSKPIYFPPGVYAISTPLKVFSQQKLYGDSANYTTTTIAGTAGFVGSSLVETDVTGVAGEGIISKLCIRDLTFDHNAAVTLWAINCTTHGSSIGNSEICNLVIKCARGIKSDGYSQHCHYHHILLRSTSNIQDRLLLFAGNDNVLEHWDKEEGVSGAAPTNDAYFEIKDWTVGGGGDSTCNRLRHILIEGHGDADKKLIRINKCEEMDIEDVWFETIPMTTAGVVHVSDSQTVRIKGFHSGAVTGAFLIDTGSTVEIESINLDGTDPNRIHEAVSVSADSHVHITTAYTRYGRGANMQDKRITIDRVVNMALLRTPANDTNVLPVARVAYIPAQNLLVNGSFEMGRFGWVAAPATATYPASTAGPGLMAVYDATTTADYFLQEITVPAGWVGKKLTFSGLVKSSVNGLSLGLVINGLGVAENNTDWAGEGTEWQLLSKTFVLTSAGTLTLGFRCGVGGIHSVDEARLAFGDTGNPGGCRVQELELKGKSITSGAAAPTTGTWKVGDLVFNSVPASGQPTWWACSVAGTPGTWIPGPNYA